MFLKTLQLILIFGVLKIILATVVQRNRMCRDLFSLFQLIFCIKKSTIFSENFQLRLTLSRNKIYSVCVRLKFYRFLQAWPWFYMVQHVQGLAQTFHTPPITFSSYLPTPPPSAHSHAVGGGYGILTFINTR